MPTRNINLTDHFDRFVEAGVASGRYQNASEVVRAALRLLEQQEQEDAAKLKRLREALQEGFDASARGDVIDVDADDIGNFVAKLGEEAAERVRQRNSQR
jgi:antitoxin ParD1/3/4